MQPALRIALLFFFASCQQPQQQQQAATNVVHTIEVVPLGAEQNSTLAKEVAAKLKAVLPDVVTDSLQQLPSSAYYKPRNRYRADSLIRWLSNQSTPNTTRLGITNVDISTTKDGKADWGVLGLGYMPGKAAVASSYRLKDKSLLWKVAIHELGHTAGLPHCPDHNCFMRDAEGGDPTGSETGFCEKCKTVLRGKHWKL